MEFNNQELADFFKTTIGTVKTNFPNLRQRALKQGYLIQKRGIGDAAIYEVTTTTPQDIPLEEFRTRQRKHWEEDLPNEVWVPAWCDPDNFEVSNLGRVRNKKTLILHKASIQPDGYRKVSINNKNYLLHRVIIFSFNPLEEKEKYHVDHIDGNRSNNTLSNLRLTTPQKNTQYKTEHRQELNKIITEILYNHNYDDIIKCLNQLKNE